MRLSLNIKIDESKLRKHTPNPIFEYAEMIEVLRAHGFVHRTPSDIGFMNVNATFEDAEKAIVDVVNKVPLLAAEGVIIECETIELGDTTHFDINKFGR